MKKLLLLVVLFPLMGNSQAILDNWILNANGQKASYWASASSGGGGGAPTFTFTISPDSADILKVCYDSDNVWIKSEGLTTYMGKYQNPGSCLGQNYVFRLPRNPTVPTSKTISPKVGAIGVLLNGVPIYGLSNAYSWSGTANVGMGGKGIWNVEVFLSEGFVLDTAFGAHPQQQGAYHSHATPYRLYKNSPSSVHSPLVGYAFDGNPVYGPYGYTSPLNTASGISRMKSGYSLRNITTRTSLPYGVSLTSSQYGPDVNTTYPLGTYCEDYEWLSSNGGDLDKYNGRFCKTPEYPNGTYAYFITIDASGTAAFPYYVGIEYYGAPDQGNFVAGGSSSNGLTVPSTATCLNGNTPAGTYDTYLSEEVTVSPNPSDGNITVFTRDGLYTTIEIYNGLGVLVNNESAVSSKTNIKMSSGPGIYILRCVKVSGSAVVRKIVIE